MKIHKDRGFWNKSTLARAATLLLLATFAAGSGVSCAEEPALAPTPTPTPQGYTLTVDKSENRGTWEGWGCSLAWWGNAVGGKKYQDLYADLFFTDKTVPFLDQKLPGLDLNIIRYNVGGGGRGETFGDAIERVPEKFPWYRDIEGFWINPASPAPSSSGWDWSRDANQRAMMQAALARGANRLEFFSNAPMWWMMTNKSSAGGSLEAASRRDFATYLASVVQHARQQWKLKVDYVAPFNEPSAGWWNYPNSQEGANISRVEQKEILGYLREELDRRGLKKVGVTASDENTMREALQTYEYFKTQQVRVGEKDRPVTSLIGKVNVHSYSGQQPWRDNKVRQALHESVSGNRLWADEFGNPDGSGMVLAQTIMEDINFLRPTAWLYWQPLEPSSAWGLVNGKFPDRAEEPQAGEPSWVYYSYYTMAQFTRFLRPGYRIIGNSDANSVVAYDQKKQRLILITMNLGPERSIDYDLTSLRNVGNSGTITSTNSKGSKLFQSSPLQLSNKRFTVLLEANSVSSIVIPRTRL